MMPFSLNNRAIFLSTALILGLSQTACLKTRAQLRDDDDGAAAPTKVQTPQEVQPQGQYVLDEIKGELTRVEGRIEDLERAQKQGDATAANSKQEDIKKLEARITELEQAQANMLEVIKKLQDSPAVAADPAEILETAKTQLEAGNLEAAITSLNAYLKTPKPKNLEQATFLRAEAYYANKDYKKAIVDYSKFPEKFTRSSRMPQALFKIGKSFEALGMKDDAKGFYQELVEKYPKSPEAKKARAKSR